MSARNGPPGDADRRPVGGTGGSSKRLGGRDHSTRGNRQNRRPLQVWAERVVVAGRDRFRLELLVWCTCGNRHAHRAPLNFTAGLRRGPCGARYIVHAGVVAAVAA